MKNLENTNRMLLDIRDSIDRIIGDLESIDGCLDDFFHENNAQLLSSESSNEEIEKDNCEAQPIESNKKYNIEQLHNMMQYHLDSVKETTGEVTIEDYEYCHNLLERIRAHQSSQNLG